MCRKIGGIASDDPGIIRRITLSFHQGLPTAVRATAKIRVLGIVVIESVDNCFRLFRGFMNCAESVVDYLLRGAERPVRIPSVGFVSRVGGGGRIAVRERHSHPGCSPASVRAVMD